MRVFDPPVSEWGAQEWLAVVHLVALVITVVLAFSIATIVGGFLGFLMVTEAFICGIIVGKTVKRSS